MVIHTSSFRISTETAEAILPQYNNLIFTTLALLCCLVRLVQQWCLDVISIFKNPSDPVKKTVPLTVVVEFVVTGISNISTAKHSHRIENLNSCFTPDLNAK
jgi:hypothetical protein